MRALIVGAGIGGLTAAIALARRGHEVTLVERAPGFAPVGAGIVLSANAMAVLDALEIDVRGAGRELDLMCSADDHGRTLSTFDFRALRASIGSVLSFHRAELHHALVEQLPSNVDLRLGTELNGVDVAPTHVDVALAEPRGRGTEARFDIVLGCDGLRSRVRACVGDDVPLRFSGETCWRAVVPAALERGVEAVGAGARFGVVPLAGDRAYLFLVRVAEAPVERSVASATSWAEMEAIFGGFAGIPASVWPAVRPAALVHHDLIELSATRWGRPRMWLLGDAAHAMTPNLGQGAGMAIEDVAALVLELDDDLTASHARWVARRRPRAEAVKRASARMGRLLSLTPAWIRAVRDALMAATPTAMVGASYRRLVQPGLNLAGELRARGM